jgi:hypothetical protein
MQDATVHPESEPQQRVPRAPGRNRLLLTLLGAGGLIAAAFLNWIRSIDALGIELNVKMLWQTEAEPKILTGGGIDSVGFVALLLGVVAIIGLLPRIRWLTTVAGALGAAEATLFVVTAARASGYRPAPRTMTVGDIRVGVWLLVAGGVLAIVAAFFGRRRPRP